VKSKFESTKLLQTYLSNLEELLQTPSNNSKELRQTPSSSSEEFLSLFVTHNIIVKLEEKSSDHIEGVTSNSSDMFKGITFNSSKKFDKLVLNASNLNIVFNDIN
jgi:hypothetical protein